MSIVSELLKEAFLPEIPVNGSMNGEEERRVQSVLRQIDFSKKEALDQIIALVRANPGDSTRLNRINSAAANSIALEEAWNNVYVNTQLVNQGLTAGQDLTKMLSAVDSISPKKRASICESAHLLIADRMSADERIRILYISLLISEQIPEHALNQLCLEVKESITDEMTIEEKVIAIAKRYAETDDVMVPLAIIQRFGIRDQEALFKIIESYAEKERRYSIIKCIQVFGITDERIQKKLALLFAEKDPMDTLINIKQFRTLGQATLIEMAEILAQKVRMGYRIQDFGITDQNALLKIAKICASLEQNSVAEYFESFIIQREVEESAVIEIAKICAKQSPASTATYFKNFGIQDPDARREIAMICAKEGPESTAKNIQNFGITDPKILAEIALMIASQPESGIANFIDNFGIIDQQEILVKIALLSAKNDPATTVENINNFYIDDPKRKNEILALCIIQTRSLSHLDRINPIFNFLYPIRIMAEYASHWNQDQALGSLNCFIDQTKFPHGNQVFEWMKSSIENAPNENAKLELAVSMAATLGILRLQFSDEQIAYAFDTKLIQAVYELRDPQHYLPFVYDVALFSSDQRERARFRAAGGSKFEEKRAVAILARMFSCRITDQPAGVLEFFQDSYKLFSDATKMRLFLTVLHHLSKETTLDLAQKKAVLEKIERAGEGVREREQRKEPIVKTLRQLDLIFDLGKGSLLSDPSKSLEEISKQAINEIIDIGNGVDDAAIRFQDTFGKSHNPTAIWQYVAKMRQLNDKKVMDTLSLFIRSVLDDSFLVKRYNLGSNVHLSAVGQETVDRWRIPLEPRSAETAQALFNPLEGQIQNMRDSQESGLLSLIDTDDPNHILLCGINNSCQRLDGDPKHNKSLLGYLMNGQTRLLAVVDTKGRIVARALIRLLLDKDKNPVLFLESRYGDKRYEKSIREYALDKSRQMNLPVTTLAPPGAPGVRLESLGGIAPFEYCDAAGGGVQKESKFALNAQLLS